MTVLADAIGNTADVQYLYADGMGLDQGTVIDFPRRFDMLPNRFEDDRLDLACRHTGPPIRRAQWRP